MDVVNAIIKPVVETLMVPVKKHLGYLISCRQYIRHMGIKMSELNDTRHSVEEYMNRNKKNHLEVPTQVEGWLEDVEKINAKVEDIPSDVGTCFNLKMRHKIGRKAFKIIEEIESATRKHSNIIWTNYPIPVGKVDLMKASTSKPSMGHHEDFQSREKTFIEALKALEPNKNSHMVALWGMGGVGKTTMMQRLKKVVKEKKMFNFVVEVVVGEQTDPIAIQEAVSNYLGLELKESTKQARADKLRKWFMDNSDEGKTKFLIILDDVWQLVDLNDIGLSSLPNQGVNFKVLLTTRNRDVCTMMGVEPYLIFNIKVLMEAESQSFFRQFVETSDDVDLELHMIGENIVRKCCGLPIAIKTMACALRSKSKDTWKDALSRLEHHDIGNVAYKVFETSYDNLEDEETKSIFLLCGLFPEDLDIPMEDLVRYGWGLKIFKKVYTIGEARIRLTTCIERLIHTNLLMEVDSVGCIKMHDLVRAFVMDMLSKVNNVHASFVNHGNILELPVDEMRDTCKRLSITCQGISEFPRDLKFPNVSILRLMDGDKYLRFPQDFYEEMEKLEVISYEKMKYPFFPSSPQSSTNLRVLHIHKCSLMMFDFSCIGDMLNLEVLSFASSNIKWLPSTIGKLKKLRLLDFTNCNGLHIDNGVLKSLVKLEELYMGVDCGRDISFTDEICNEIAERLKRLYTLELMFFEKLKMKNMSFEKLQRFKISMGRYLDKAFGKHVYSFENTLQLATTKVELLESRLNELFEKTEVLYLSLGDMYDLLDIEVKPSHPIHSSSFYNLRVLVVSECLELIYLFTLDVAKTLSKLEHIEVYKCENMEELIYTDGSGDEKIRFPKLKFLSLHWLPRLLGLCNNVNIIELPQLMELKLDFIPRFTSIYSENKFETSSLLKKEVVIPILEKLDIQFMVDLKEIWPCEFSTREEVKLREINVRYCKNLVNLFPCNPLPLLHHLEELVVDNCSSIEVLFNIDLDCVSEIYSNLKNIKANELGKLREVWRINGANNSHLLIRGFQAVESINIRECKMFRNVFTPITTNFDLGALMEISITREDWRNNYELEETSQEQVQTYIKSKGNTSEICYTMFPSGLIHSFHNLHKLELSTNEELEAVFEIESTTSRELITTHHNQHQLLPCLEDLEISYMKTMNHVWKCNWNKFLNLQKQQSESAFLMLTTIHIKSCESIKYLFSPLMAKLLSNLKGVRIDYCDGIEEVVSNKDDEDEKNIAFTSTSTHTSMALFPRLDYLFLILLPNLRCIGGGWVKGGNNEISSNYSNTTNASIDQFQFSQVGGVSWTLCQYSREITIVSCNALSSVIPCYAVGQMQKLQVLNIIDCDGMKEVFETQGMNNNTNSNGGYEDGNDGTLAIPRVNNVIMLPNLKILEIMNCNLLEHIFKFSTLESLKHLEELTIRFCYKMKVIVQDDDGEKTTSSFKVVVFPHLKSITLEDLPELMGFFLGIDEFQWPSLDKVMIKYCPKMMVFAPGGSTAPQLKYIHTQLGKHSLECGLNFHVKTIAHHQTPLFPGLDSIGSFLATSEGIPWSFHNLIEAYMAYNQDVEKIFTSNEFLQLKKLENIHVSWCFLVEVFEAFEAQTNSSGVDESQTTIVKLPNLIQVELTELTYLRYIWKSNRWTIFEFPNLTRVSIEGCNMLEHVFTSSMVSSLLQLQDLYISRCDYIEEVIVKDENVVVQAQEEEESYGKVNDIVLHHLKSLELDSLRGLKGFWLGKENFSFPLLDTLIIKHCQAITTFTMGNLATPQLKEIEIDFDSYYVVGEDINSIIKSKLEEFQRDRSSWM